MGNRLITLDTLKEAKACSVGLKWFEKNFPNGVELLQLLKSDIDIPKTFLLWAEYSLEQFYQGEIIDLMQKRLNIIDTTFCRKSYDVIHSSYVYKSHNIEQSSEILGSRFVKFGYNIADSANIDNSSYCRQSTNIIQSQQIVSCSNLKNCSELYKCYDSKECNYGYRIHNSRNVIFSSEINNSSNISYSILLNNCKNCIFCSNLTGQENMIFNKPVSEEEFLAIKNKLDEILNNSPKILSYVNLPEHIFLDKKQVDSPIHNLLRLIPINVWSYIKELPYYDEIIFYTIRGAEEILTK